MNHGSADDGLSSRGRPPLNKLLAKIASPESELPREEYAWFEMAASEHIATLPKNISKSEFKPPPKSQSLLLCHMQCRHIDVDYRA